MNIFRKNFVFNTLNLMRQSNIIEQTSIMKFVARSILLLLAETTPSNSLLARLRTMLSDDIEKDAVVDDFFLSLEQLIKAKMHDIWYIMVQYILEYQKRHECNIISTDFVSLHLSRVFRNVMLNKDVNFIGNDVCINVLVPTDCLILFIFLYFRSLRHADRG